MITEIAGWSVVGLYVLIGLYVLAETLSVKHVRTYGARVRARIAWEAAAWPIAVLPWRELPSLWRQWRRRVRAAWSALPVRYSEVGS